MMSGSRMLFMWLVLGSVASIAKAQTSTASLFPAAFQQFGLEGEVHGTGTDGTTYVLSGIDSVTQSGVTTEALPLTMTLVEDATHVSEIAVISEGEGQTFSVNAQCALVSGLAFCTESLSEGTQVTQLTETGSLSLIAVPVVTGKVTITSLPPSLTSVSDTTSTQPQQITITDLSQTAPQSTTSTTTSSASLKTTGIIAQIMTAVLGLSVIFAVTLLQTL